MSLDTHALATHAVKMPLSVEDVESYRRNGFIHIAGFYDVTRDVEPILRDMRRLLALLAEEHGLPIDFHGTGSGRDDFDLPLVDWVRNHRQIVRILYDALKKLQSYISLACDRRNAELAALLLGTDFAGFANRGYGIRMDNPAEDHFLTQLHQDYVSQMCSPRGIVIWSPLRDITDELGPVELFTGSHVEGILPIRKLGSASQDYLIADEQRILDNFPIARPLPKVGDVVVSDFLLVHRSSPNRSNRTRWAMISRYFDFLDPVGQHIGWHGGLQEGRSFSEAHPDLCRTE